MVKSVTIPESRLKKNHLSIYYHAILESVAGGKVRIVWTTTGINISDLLTKVMEGPKICEIASKNLH